LLASLVGRYARALRNPGDVRTYSELVDDHTDGGAGAPDSSAVISLDVDTDETASETCFFLHARSSG
jgi:hypothetical protein